MNRHTIIIAGLALCFLPTAQAPAATGTTDGSPTISLTKLEVTDKSLEVSYEIKNSSGQDIWICEGAKVPCRNFEVEMADDDHTLLIRRRSDVPMIGSGERPFYSYTRIPRSCNLKESLLLSLPVHPYRVILGGRRSSKDIQHAKRIMFEIGYYSRDFPDRVFGMLDEVEKNHHIAPHDELGVPSDVIGWLGDSVVLNRLNENVADRNERFVIPWTDRTLKGEHVLRATADGLHIPYTEDDTPIEFKSEKIHACKKIEITYQPSMLEHFFIYPGQQSLLNTDEVEYLRSQKTVVFDARQLVKALTDELSQGTLGGLIVTEHSKTAHVVCYDEEKQLTSFTVYDDRSIVTPENKCFWYRDGLQSMRMLTSQIHQATPFRFRIECAANLRILWHRLCLYHKARQMSYTDKGVIEVAEPISPEYPTVNEWCDSMLRSYVPLGGTEAHIAGAYKCPGAGDGKCHYGMNPNCKPDSPSNMVLLFETKDGWNQHGGPELFTFDNHDPKGGCVLLNDGTVKFIRTVEELRQLRWE